MVAPGQSHYCELFHHYHSPRSPIVLPGAAAVHHRRRVSARLSPARRRRQPSAFPCLGACWDHAAASPRYYTTAWSSSLVAGLPHHLHALRHLKCHSHGGPLGERRIECVAAILGIMLTCELMVRRPADPQPHTGREAHLPVPLPAGRHREARRHNGRDCRQVLRAHQAPASCPGRDMADRRHGEPRSVDHGRLLPGPASDRTLPGWQRSRARACL